MKINNISNYILSLCVTAFVCASTNLSAQDIKIALVDVQMVLNKYKRTQVEVDKINKFYENRQTEIKAKRDDAQKIVDKAKVASGKAQDSSFSQAIRQESAVEYQSLLTDFSEASKTISDTQRKSSQEIIKARQEMEATLVQDMRTVMKQIAESDGIDLIFDKSFLPKANKAIIYQSDNVIDLTDRIIETLNK